MFCIALFLCPDKGFCTKEIVNNIMRGTYKWEESEVGENITINCTYGSLDGMGVASRLCKEPRIWDEARLESCLTENARDFQDISVSCFSYKLDMCMHCIV